MAICYRDREYCTAACATDDCYRKLTDQVRADADRWWGNINGHGAPIAQRDMSSSCPYFTPEETATDSLTSE